VTKASWNAQRSMMLDEYNRIQHDSVCTKNVVQFVYNSGAKVFNVRKENKDVELFFLVYKYLSNRNDCYALEVQN